MCIRDRFPPDILPAEAVEHPVGRRGGEAQGQGGNGGGRRGGFQRRRAVGAGRKGFLQPLGAADAGEPEGAPGLALSLIHIYPALGQLPNWWDADARRTSRDG